MTCVTAIGVWRRMGGCVRRTSGPALTALSSILALPRGGDGSRATRYATLLPFVALLAISALSAAPALTRAAPRDESVGSAPSTNTVAACSAADRWCVSDDRGQIVRLPHAAHRIVSLAPHITELVYAAGAGNALVGVVNYSDYPAAARTLPSVGSYMSVDVERIAALHPDLVLAWGQGRPQPQWAALAALGIPVYVDAPAQVDDIGASLRRLGVLFGTTPQADREAARVDAGFAALRAEYANRSRVDVFFQVWSHPLMTLSGRQITSDVIALCGGRNVFADLPGLAPTVSTEAVIAAAPQAIVTPALGATHRGDATALANANAWKAWPSLPAVAAGNLFSIDGDLISRPGPRLLDGARALCADLDRARRRLVR